MRSLASTILVRLTWALTVAALLALSISAGLFDLSRPGRAATAALSSPAGQRLATDFIADQLRVAVPGLSEKKAHDLATKVAADPGTLAALKKANLKSASAPQDRAALLGVVASQLKDSNPKVAAATEKYADQVKADQADDARAEPPSPVGGLLKRVQQFTGGATNVSAVMSDLKERLANAARVLAALAAVSALAALAFAPSRARVVRSFGWMFISISLIPAAIGWLVPDLVLARMSSDWAQALAVGLRVGGGRLIGLFVGLLCAGVVLLALGTFGAGLGSLVTPTRTPGERAPRPNAPYPPGPNSPYQSGPNPTYPPGPNAPYPPGPNPTYPPGPNAPYPSAGRTPARGPRPGPSFPDDPAVTRPLETVHPDDPRYGGSHSGYPYQQPSTSPGGQYPDYGPYGEPPTEPDPYGPAGDGGDRRR